MLDLRKVRENPEAIATLLAKRGFVFDADAFNQLEAARKDLQIKVEALQNERNQSAKSIGKAKAAGEDIQPLLEQVASLKDALSTQEAQLQSVQAELHGLMMGVPNVPHSTVPEGKDENDNVVVRTVGTVTAFDFHPQDHVAIGTGLAGLDFETASKITGSRFVTMHGKMAKLHRALTQFMLDTHIEEHGYHETYVPYLANADSLRGTGQLPKFKEDLFSLQVADTLSETEEVREFFLIPTAEVPVTNIYRDTIVEAKDLPIKRVCHTPCFRSEAGSYGRDTKGLIRQHQFEKVEMVQLVKASESYEALEALTAHAEVILQKLNLPYQVIVLCGGDTGFSSAKTYDIEVWLPSQNTYREISSCSNFEDFQARRMQARWRNPETGKPELLHTLNGSGLAVGRTLVAILENYQAEDGSVTIPDALVPYMGGVTRLTKEAE